ncbi:hypothetical protein [Psychrobacillus sp. NPDC096389]|uniref:hypothetical protein n=1 Tax=Psychrobacillus sp. NPDC096389 TaxID=3364490 RepID=UPI0037FD76C9
MQLWTYVGKHVRVLYKDGDVLEGFVQGYDDGEDNEDGVDSLSISNKETDEGDFIYGVSENEIEAIEIIK